MQSINPAALRTRCFSLAWTQCAVKLRQYSASIHQSGLVAKIADVSCWKIVMMSNISAINIHPGIDSPIEVNHSYQR